MHTHSHKWSKVNLKRTPPRSIFYTCALSFPFFISLFFFFFFGQKLPSPHHDFSYSPNPKFGTRTPETCAKLDSPCLTLCNFYLHLHAWHNSGHRKKNHNTEVEKSASTSSLQKKKSKLLYVCIIITLEYLNSITIGQNTHIKK